MANKGRKFVSIELADKFNEATAEALEISKEACDRLKSTSEPGFMVSNYKTAVQSLSKVVDYIRDFAGASSTAPIEAKIKEMLDSVESHQEMTLKERAKAIADAATEAGKQGKPLKSLSTKKKK